MPSHYVKQWWNIVNLTHINKLQWNFNRNSYIFIQENAAENVVWKISTIVSQPHCVKSQSGISNSHIPMFSCRQDNLTHLPWTKWPPFPDDISKCIFMNEKFCVLIRISLKFVPKNQEKGCNNIPALVQIMAWRRSGDKLLSEPILLSTLTSVASDLFNYVLRLDNELSARPPRGRHGLWTGLKTQVGCLQIVWWNQ